ncbi:hypothetical protein NL676_020221 [Syzygium grande]|nr:hypothetical protein NL676_020221 [Syzygium grande]
MAAHWGHRSVIGRWHGEDCRNPLTSPPPVDADPPPASVIAGHRRGRPYQSRAEKVHARITQGSNSWTFFIFAPFRDPESADDGRRRRFRDAVSAR